MLCEHCGQNEVDYIIDGLRVCSSCKEKASLNFLIKCVNCNAYCFIARNVHNYARLAMMHLLSERIEVNEATFNTMIANIEVSRPTVFQVEECPNCAYCGEGIA